MKLDLDTRATLLFIFGLGGIVFQQFLEVAFDKPATQPFIWIYAGFATAGFGIGLNEYMKHRSDGEKDKDPT